MQLQIFLDNSSPEDLRSYALQYLEGDGDNKKLKERIESTKCRSIELINFPLKDLKRIIGPDPKLAYFEEEEMWETRVEKLVTAIKDGYEPLPLFATNFWGRETALADGNHRHEALLRSGYDTYWVVFFTEQQKF
jgi:hypothetical protein